ncbi:MAG: ThuA domain-containing protein [Pseudomonadota bacterium]|jgi:type 1 glutamine amidotransferase
MRALAALIYTGGISHPFAQSAPILAEVLSEAGFTPRIFWDLEELVIALQADPKALLVVYALRWGMTQHEKYAPDRAQWALHISDAARQAIHTHVHAGGGLLGLHTASICFDDWADWSTILGGGWRWGISHHPPLGPVQVTVDRTHPLAHDLADFVVVDEAYTDLAVAASAQVIATVMAPGGAPQPAIWTHRYGAGRVLYDSVGHDGASLSEATHRQLIQRGARWATNAQ